MPLFIAKCFLVFFFVFGFATLSTCTWTAEDLLEMVRIRVCKKRDSLLDTAEEQLFELGPNDAYPAQTMSGFICGYVISDYGFLQRFPQSDKNFKNYSYFIQYKNKKLGKVVEDEFKISYNRVLLFTRKDGAEMDPTKKVSLSFKEAPDTPVTGRRTQIWIQGREFSNLLVQKKELEQIDFTTLESFATVEVNGVPYGPVLDDKASDLLPKRNHGVSPTNGKKFIDAATFLVITPRPIDIAPYTVPLTAAF